MSGWKVLVGLLTVTVIACAVFGFTLSIQQLL